MISSLQELIDTCDEWNNQAFQENSDNYTIELSQKLRSYDETFFSDRNLIIYSFDRGHGNKTKIDGIDVQDSKLIINAQIITKKGVFTSEAFNWLILIEIKKADVIGVESLEVVYN